MSVTTTAKPLFDAAYVGSSETLIYECPANTKAIIDKFTACNVDTGSAKKLDVWIVPSGGSRGDANRVIYELSISAKGTEDLTKLQNQVLKAGDKIFAIAETASKIVARVSGREAASA